MKITRVLPRISTALIAASALAFGLLAAPSAALAAPPGPYVKINVMAPLYMRGWDKPGDAQWNDFVSDLSEAKKMGVDGVAVDVWWGLVQNTSDPTKFNWSYYEKVFQAITNAGLKIDPMMSFHQCGGNAGDGADCPEMAPIKIPSFVWDPIPYAAGGITTTVPADDYFTDEYGNVNKEALAPWGEANRRNIQYMQQFMSTFQQHFGSRYANKVDSIAISLGPAGELRYPSYTDSPGRATEYRYPNQGVLQAYSPAAKESFKRHIVNKYGSAAAAGAAWGISGLTEANILAPGDHANFFTSGAYSNIQYGKDFTAWYNQSLLDHGKRILTAALNAFTGEFKSTVIVAKSAGIHWQAMAGSPIRRSAEVAAGVIRSDNMNSASNGYGYKPLFDMLKDVKAAAGTHDVWFDFTCLEKDNLEWDGSAHAYSAALDQVGWLADAAAAAGIKISGENALAGGLWSYGGWRTNGWNHIFDAFKRSNRYYGLTILRLDDVTRPGTLPYNEFARFIRENH